MPIVLPIAGEDADERITIALEGQDYDIRVRWNTLDCSWYCYIGAVNREPTIKSKLVCGVDLISPYTHLGNVPKGALLLVDSEKLFGRAARDNFGVDKRFQLFYILETELNG